jgi:transposase-like protein
METFNIENLKFYSCPNKSCSQYGLIDAGNISVRCKYGKNDRTMLYCRTCGQRFSATRETAFFGSHLSSEIIKQIIRHAAEGVGVRATARLLKMDKDTVDNVVLRVGRHCAEALSRLLRSLDLTEVQLDELWAFVKKNNVMKLLETKTTQTKKVESKKRKEMKQ